MKAPIGGLLVAGQVIGLQSPADIGAHFSCSLTRTWSHWVGEHEVKIVKVRPLFLAGFRANDFTVSVDGRVVAQARGL